MWGLFTLAEAEGSLKSKGVAPNGVPPFPWYSDAQIFDEWLTLEYTQWNWWRDLPKCPSQICVDGNGKADNPDSTVWTDPNVGLVSGFALAIFHPGAVFELRTLPNAQKSPHGNQCTYDIKGALIMTQPAGGTADFYGPHNPYNGFIGHRDHDISPFNLANSLGRVHDYYLVRPIW